MLRSTFIHAPGVGYPTEARLWREGFRTWDEFLENSPRLRVGRERTRAIHQEIERSRSRLRAGDYRYFARRLKPRDQWRAIGEWGSKAVFLDIETTGPRGKPHPVTRVGLHRGRGEAQVLRGTGPDGVPPPDRKGPHVAHRHGSPFRPPA